MNQRVIGSLLILVSLTILFLTFWPVVKEEVRYDLNQTFRSAPVLTAPNKDFSIVIQKIGAAAPIIDNVDSQNPSNYLPALRRGVAQAKGTAHPGESGNVYLFAHSTDAFYNLARYNAVFYLIGKLEKGDEISVWYKGKEYKYAVSDKKVVAPSETKYLGSLGPGKTLTLQTCYPPGTTIGRLVVIALEIE